MNEIYRYRKLQQFGTLILRESKPEDIQKTLFELLPEVIDIDGAALFIQSEKGRWFLQSASTNGILLKSVRPRLKAFAEKMNDEGNAPQVMASPLIIERPVCKKSGGFPIIVAYPILIMGKITAFLVTARKKDRSFSTDDLNRLDHVAAILSTSMENQFAVEKLRSHANHLEAEKKNLTTKVVQRTLELDRERELASLFKERAPYLVFVLNNRGTIVFANALCLEVTGYPTDRVQGMNFLDLLYPDDRPEKQEWFTALFKTMDSQSFQTTLVARGGDHRMIIWNVIKRKGGRGKPAEVLCIGRDVTRRAHLEAHNRVLLETLPDGMFRVNKQFEVVEVNKHAANLLGLEPQSLLGKKCYETICNESPDTCPVFGKGKEAVTYEAKIPTEGEQEIPVLKSIRKYRLGASEYALETFKDIGPLKKMEQKVRDYAENLEKKVEKRTSELKEAQCHLIEFEKLVATGRMAASLAHEINNPIYGIRGCLQSILEEVELEEDLRKYTELSVKETDRISDLIKRLQNFHKDSKKRRGLEDVSQSLKDILVLNNKYLQENQIDLQACFQPNLPRVHICADEIKQVFFNLLRNAVESMQRKGRLTVKTVCTGDQVEIHFFDTGVGIPRNVRERIFDPFFTTKAAVKGVGLGLSVCWGIVQRHGGQIRVESKLKIGSTFVVSLPVARKEVSSKPAKKSQAPPTRSAAKS